ncbi:ERF family protein [Selenomonas sp.]|uniref:ERF family protein n=2 Tax=Selenomonas sp. TaxID=2053611 RepID=UPI0025DA66C1|nr:ERF family protein [Selenomonas sp.]MCI6284264.1 ERF family protein [Selenomonas sp.]
MEGKAINAALMAVQRDLKAPKSNTNSFGKYRYRSCEDILEAVKPLLNENGLVLLLGDTIEQIGSRYYVKATATLIDVATGDTITNTALAREPEEKKGSDASQVTGAASSYARKYCLNGLFAIDDTKDPDTDEYRRESQNRAVASGNGNANNVPRSGGNGAQTGAQAAKTANDKASAVRALNEEMKRTGASGKEVQQIAEAMVHKSSVNDMTAYEVALLAKNLEAELAKRAGA